MKSVIDSLATHAADLPLARARTIPSAWYTDPAVADLEFDRVFARTWQPVARVDQLVDAGQFVTAEIGHERIVVVRGERLRAFYNVCRHHAAKVVTAETGCARRFHCPYHGWTYGLDGALLSTPSFDGVEDFERAEHGLVEVAVDIWQQWVFVNLDPTAAPLAQTLGELEVRAAPLDLMALVHRKRVIYDLECNWKVFVDNYLDGGYHVPFLHRGLSAVLDNRAYTIETGSRYCLQSCPIATGDAPEGRVRTGECAWYFWQYPNFMLNWYEGVMDTNLVIPVGVDRCQVVYDYYFDPRLDDEAVAQSIAVSDRIQAEDMDICRDVQRGLGSRSYDVGRLSVTKEAGAYLFHQLLSHDLRQAAP